MSDEMKKTFKEFNEYSRAMYPRIIELTNDNSFSDFFINMITNMEKDLIKATEDDYSFIQILEEENAKHPINKNNLERYFSTIEYIANYSKINEKIINLFKSSNLIIGNWLKMIQGIDDNDVIDLEKDSIKLYLEKVTMLNDILDGNLTLRDLIRINRSLINRAELLLHNVPSTFRPSESFAKLLEEAVSESNNNS